MFYDKLDADRFFARITRLDLECPACGHVYAGTGSQGPYNRHTGIFKCANCKLVLALGVVAWPTTHARLTRTVAPADQVPSPRQANALRQAGGGFWPRPPQHRRPREPRNVVIRAGCRCVVEGTALLIHPACPVHGSTAKRGE